MAYETKEGGASFGLDRNSTEAKRIAAALVEFRKRDGCSAAIICAMALQIGYDRAISDLFEASENAPADLPPAAVIEAVPA